MKKLLIPLTFVILIMSSFALATTLSIFPGTLSLSGKANEEICGNLILKYSVSGTVEGTDLWASQGTEKRLGLYNLKAGDLGITVTYPTQVYLTGNVNKEIEVCVTAQNQGTFQGALFYVPAYGSGNQAPGVGTWFSVNIQGISDISEADVPDPSIPQFNANEPKTINANQISIEVTTQKTVSGNVNVVEYTQNIENPGLIGIATPIDITADPEIANNLKSAVIKRYYNEDEIIFKNVDENSLKLYYYNHDKSEWGELSSVVNTNENYVQATVTHFSIYSIFGEENGDTDLDRDGVDNDADVCPGTPSGESVNNEGCSCSQLVVDDGNVCTDDSCNNGIITHTNNNAQCGYVRNCLSDGCSGTNWIDYPNDGHDYCSGGTCQVYSCAAISSTYNTDCNADDDSDNDGVIDSLDNCPDTPSGESVNDEGCSCSQLVVDDGNVCTNDLCNNGIVTHSNNNAQCGIARDCPSDRCRGRKWLNYPIDGHDYCSAGQCNIYSCALISSKRRSRCDDDEDDDDDDESSSNEESDETTSFMATVPASTLPDCMEAWSCTKWGECVNGKQTRKCKDSNNCLTINKPVVSRSCTAEKTTPLTGSAVGAPKSNNLPSLLVGIFIILLIVTPGISAYLLIAYVKKKMKK